MLETDKPVPQRFPSSSSIAIWMSLKKKSLCRSEMSAAWYSIQDFAEKRSELSLSKININIFILLTRGLENAKFSLSQMYEGIKDIKK